MVPEPAEQCETIKDADLQMKAKKTDRKVSWWMVGLVFATALVVTSLMGFLVSRLLTGRANGDATVMVGECPGMNGNVVNSDECVTEMVTVEKIDFQSVVDEWAESVGGQKGVIVYDLTAGAVAGEYNADVKFATASLYKLFVVYAGYMKVENGEWDASEMAGATGRTIGECLDLAIRESNSECAETIRGIIGQDELDVVVQEEFGLPEVEVGSLMATPREVMEMMRIYYAHSEIRDDTLVTTMWDSFLNQPVTTYDWRMGLPSGFSDEVLVYNKVGWDSDGVVWLVYNDAAIVDFVGTGRKFIVVVMTSGMDFRSVRRLGENFEQYFRQQPW